MADDLRHLMSPDVTSGPLVRLWSRPLSVHVAALVLVLVVALTIVGDEGVFSSDEGAGLAQAEAVADGSWGILHPFAEIDREGIWFPLEKSLSAEDGGFAPLPKKPSYMWVAAQLWPLGGPMALMALSAAATVVTALLAAVLSRLVGDGLERSTLWLTGLASPLLADGLLVIGHAVAAAAAGLAALAAMRWWQQGGTRWLGLLVVATCVGGLVRAESLLLAAAMAASCMAAAALRRDRRPLVLGLAIAAAGVVGRMVDVRLATSLFGGGPPSLGAPGGSGSGGGGLGYLDDRLTAFVTTWLRPGYGDVGVPQLVAVLVAFLGVAAVILLRRGEPPAVVSSIGVLIAVMVVWRVIGRSPIPDVVPGLLIAFPLFAWGIAGLTRRLLSDPVTAWCGGTFVLFSAAVVATQYREGGAWEWGGRYFAVGLPLATPLLVLGGRETLRRLDEPALRVATMAVVVVGLSSAVLQVLAVRDSHVLGHRLVDRVLEVAQETSPGDGGRPVILSTEPELPRSAWRDLDRARWLYVPVGDLNEAMSRLGAAGVDAVVVATLAAPAAADALPQLAEGPGPVPPAGLWWFQPVDVT